MPQSFGAENSTCFLQLKRLSLNTHNSLQCQVSPTALLHEICQISSEKLAKCMYLVPAFITSALLFGLKLKFCLEKAASTLSGPLFCTLSMDDHSEQILYAHAASRDLNAEAALPLHFLGAGHFWMVLVIRAGRFTIVIMVIATGAGFYLFIAVKIGAGPQYPQLIMTGALLLEMGNTIRLLMTASLLAQPLALMLSPSQDPNVHNGRHSASQSLLRRSHLLMSQCRSPRHEQTCLQKTDDCQQDHFHSTLHLKHKQRYLMSNT